MVKTLCRKLETFLCYLTVHVVLCFDEFASVNLARVGLTGDDVTLGFMQNFYGDSDRHGVKLQHNKQVTDIKHNLQYSLIFINPPSKIDHHSIRRNIFI